MYTTLQMFIETYNDKLANSIEPDKNTLADLGLH